MPTDRTKEIDALLVHEPSLRGVARSILREESRVDDVVQDTWRAALTHRPRNRGAIRSWLGKIAGNFARRSLRGDASRSRREGAQDRRPTPPTPAEIAEREETRKRVLSALMSLSDSDRDILLFRFYEDLPPREVARRLDIPTETARTRIRRALGRLKEELDEGYGGDRRARVLALVPLAGFPLPGGGLAVLTTKLLLGAAAILIGVVGVVHLADPDRPARPQPSRTIEPALPPSLPPASSPQEEEAETAEPPAEEAPRPAPEWTGGYAGMASIPAGTFEMGLDESWFLKAYLGGTTKTPPQLLGPQKDEIWWPMFLLETPAHLVSTGAYAIDRYEVTNAQYLEFLDDACSVEVTTGPGKRTLEQIAGEIHDDNFTRWQAETLFWLNEEQIESIARQVLEANAGRIQIAIDRFNADLPQQARKSDFEDLPEANRVAAWIGFDLPAGTLIRGYTRTVPRHWEKAQPVASEDVNRDQMAHPVRWISGEDAEAFAEWAGKRVPTEEEWERAARGPENTVYPWGDTWDCRRERDRVIWNGARSWEGAPGRNRPARVNSVPEGKSGYGCFHMIGNVMEWTSSVPRAYPGTRARWHSFGGLDLRVCRGGAYGGGVAFRGREISMRTTARILDGPGGAVAAANRYEAVGFRCAKDAVPARDILAARVRRLARDGLLPKDLDLDLGAAFGAERVSYDPDANGRMVFVTGRARAIGVVPRRLSPIPTVNGLLAASEESPRVLCLLSVDKDVVITTPAGEHLPGGDYLVAIQNRRAVLLRPVIGGSRLVGTLDPIPSAPLLSRLARNESAGAKLDVESGILDLLIPIPVDTPPRAAPLALRLRIQVRIPETIRDGW